MKKVVIVGGGIAGLTAGIYLQQAGFETEIYEKMLLQADSAPDGTEKAFILITVFTG